MNCLACNGLLQGSICDACGREYFITQSPTRKLFAIPNDEAKLARFFGIYFANRVYALYTDGSGLIILRYLRPETVRFIEDLLLIKFYRPPSRPPYEYWTTNIGLLNWLRLKLKLKRREGKRSLEPTIVPSECSKFPREFARGLRENGTLIMPYKCCHEFLKKNFGWPERKGIFITQDVSN